MSKLIELLRRNQHKLRPLLPVEWQKAKTYTLNMGPKNSDFADLDPNDTEALMQRTQELLKQHDATLALGRYAEQRTLYQRSKLFNAEMRSIHLGLDLMLPPGTEIATPLDGTVHSFKDNADLGDYGPTIILQHQLDNTVFHILYGHLNQNSLINLEINQSITAGQVFCAVGDVAENGQWPPHLHLQIIIDLEGWSGDYPGVINPKESKKYLVNCPDPSILITL